ncbi:MAG: hypothetical protein ACRC2S_24055 [Waterburya sp.]
MNGTNKQFLEGLIALNFTAVAILTKCDGHRSFEAIAYNIPDKSTINPGINSSPDKL